MVRGCDVVMPIRFQASDRVLFLELEVVYEPLKQIPCPWHFLETWEEARLSLFREGVFLGTPHVGMVSNF